MFLNYKKQQLKNFAVGSIAELHC